MVRSSSWKSPSLRRVSSFIPPSAPSDAPPPVLRRRSASVWLTNPPNRLAPYLLQRNQRHVLSPCHGKEPSHRLRVQSCALLLLLFACNTGTQ